MMGLFSYPRWNKEQEGRTSTQTGFGSNQNSLVDILGVVLSP